VSRFAVVNTARLGLTAISMDDLEDFHALHSDPQAHPYDLELMHPDRDHSQSVIEMFVDDWATWKLGYWTIRTLDGREYLGCAGIRRNDVNWNVYYRFRPSAWGNGFATEVIRAAAPCAEAVEPGAHLQLVMRPDNSGSRRVADRLNLLCCGTQPDHTGAPELVYQLPAADLR
jgi:ribosomal-protein-alanine N-acetyltransferase